MTTSVLLHVFRFSIFPGELLSIQPLILPVEFSYVTARASEAEMLCLVKLLCHCREYGARVEDYVDEGDLSVPYLKASSSKEGNRSDSKLKRSLLDFGERGLRTVA